MAASKKQTLSKTRFWSREAASKRYFATFGFFEDTIFPQTDFICRGSGGFGRGPVAQALYA